jgi:hypothetical protein
MYCDCLIQILKTLLVCLILYAGVLEPGVHLGADRWVFIFNSDE